MNIRLYLKEKHTQLFNTRGFHGWKNSQRNQPHISLPRQSFACILYPGKHAQEYEETVLTHFELAGQECFFSKHSSTSVREKNTLVRNDEKDISNSFHTRTAFVNSFQAFFTLTSLHTSCLLVLHASTSIYTRTEQNRMEYNIIEFKADQN